MREEGVQGFLWTQDELQEKKPDFKTWVKSNRAPELWHLTWDKCVELCNCGGSMISWEGHIIAGRDKPLEQVGENYARAMYLHTLKMACQAGKDIPEDVRAAEAEFFSSLCNSA
jgi:hypothetical protein